LLTTSVSLGQQANLALTLRNDGTKTLEYSASLPDAWYGTWRSDQPDGPPATWIAPPADAITIGLSDDGISEPIDIGFAYHFFDQSYTTVLISANGLLSFGPLSGAITSYTSGCLPLAETPNAALIPLRADLDPSQAGARVSYARTADGFLVSWEDVPLFDTLSQRLSFQALLRPDGRATMNYKQVGTLPPNSSASAGAQQSATSIQSLGCGSSLSIVSGDTIELRPQPNTTLWASLPSPSGSIAPGQQVSLPVTLSWINAAPSWPTSAELVIVSNDPLRPTIRASVRMSAASAPFNTRLPIIMR
jgi:hypothetical protein